MPPALLASLEAQERPLPSLRREMVRIIAAELCLFNARPGRSQLRQLCEKIVAAYPVSMRDVVGSNVVGSGYDSLMLQLES